LREICFGKVIVILEHLFLAVKIKTTLNAQNTPPGNRLAAKLLISSQLIGFLSISL
jgi:hypothetical protein